MKSHSVTYKSSSLQVLLCALLFATVAYAAEDMAWARQQCEALGFKPKTEQYGKCVLQLSKPEEVKPVAVPQQVQPPVQTYSGPSSCVGSPSSWTKWTNCNGSAKFSSGSEYIGEWRDGMPNGQGTYTWPNNRQYVGGYRDGKQHGQGIMTRPDGTKYVGEWKDNVVNGQGIMTRPDGSVLHSGMWVDGKPVK